MTTKKQEKSKFSKAFWVANTVELFEPLIMAYLSLSPFILAAS